MIYINYQGGWANRVSAWMVGRIMSEMTWHAFVEPFPDGKEFGIHATPHGLDKEDDGGGKNRHRPEFEVVNTADAWRFMNENRKYINLRLNGFFADSRFFESFREQIKTLVEFGFVTTECSEMNLAIHFRCRDYGYAFPGRTSRIIDPSYHIAAIEWMRDRFHLHVMDDLRFTLISDDLDHPSVSAVVAWLTLRNLTHSVGLEHWRELRIRGNEIDLKDDGFDAVDGLSQRSRDFNFMMHSHYVVSSNSSFCFWATFLGRLIGAMSQTVTFKRGIDVPGHDLSVFQGATPFDGKFEGE